MRTTIFVVLDSMRRDHLGAYNDAIDVTEHIDRIAEVSIMFENAVAQAPWTLPSHASMFTGLYPWEHGATNEKAHLETDKQTVAEKFRNQDYVTAAITPNIWVTPHKGMTDGFTEVENYLGVGDLTPLQKLYRTASGVFERLDERVRRPIVEQLNRLFDAVDIDTACRSEETIAAAIDFIEEYSDERFFLFVNLMDPQGAYNPPQQYLDRNNVQDLSAVPDYNEDFFTGEADYEELRKAYLTSVDYTGDLVGRLDRALSEHGLDEAALVVAGDHGQALGEGNVFGHQFTVREEVVSVPLFVRHPNESPDRDGRLVELRELYWLLPQVAGIESSDDLGTDAVVGDYEFPQVFKRYLPEDSLDYYYRKYRFYRTNEEKLVKSEQEDGTVSYTRIDRNSGETRPVDTQHRRLLDRIGDVGGDVDGDVTGDVTGNVDSDVTGNVDGDDPQRTAEREAAIKKRLEELGYR